MKKIIVIGSGFGGLSITSRLRSNGFDTTLIEKQPDLGGRARTFLHEGYKYDAGPTVITAPYLIEELFNIHSEKLSDYVNLLPVKPWYRFLFDNNEYLDYGENLRGTVKEIRTKKKYIEYQVDFDRFNHDLDDKKEVLKFADLELIFKDLKTLFEKRGFIINWKELEKQSLDETINALAMASPFTLEEKQILLEADNLNTRKNKIADILSTYTYDVFNNTTLQ